MISANVCLLANLSGWFPTNARSALIFTSCGSHFSTEARIANLATTGELIRLT